MPPTSPTGCYFACTDWYRRAVKLQAVGDKMPLTDYDSALEFLELSDFPNVPILHGRYEADQKCCSSPQHLRTGQLRNLPLLTTALIVVPDSMLVIHLQRHPKDRITYMH